MAKPLRSEENAQPVNLQFTHFGVMNAGTQSKTSLVTSVAVNLLLAVIVLIIGAAAKVTIENNRKVAELVMPVNIPKPEPPPPPKLVVKLPKPPLIKPVEPKILLPEVKIPDPPRPIMKVERPLPAVAPAPPKAVIAAAAPQPTTVNLGRSASIINNSQHPAPVALGRTDNPIAPSNAPATATVNLGQRGLPGMAAGNTGAGPASARVNLGSGQPNGSLGGNGARAVQGVKLGGITNGTGNTPGNGIGSRQQTVLLGQVAPPAAPRAAEVSKASARSGPQVVFKPRPVYTAEATALHLEGVVSVRIHVSAAGAVQVLGVTSGLGHGLDQSAERAVAGTRFKPAVDAQGNPTDWDGVVNVTFQIAS